MLLVARWFEITNARPTQVQSDMIQKDIQDVVACGRNIRSVDSFFNKLATVMDRQGFSASDIWNLDETGLITVQKPRNVVATKGVKQIGAITSAERGELITMCFAVSATGNTVPPMFIIPRVKYQDHFIKDGPVDSNGAPHTSGWMTHDNFLKFIEHFVKRAVLFR